MGLKKQVNDLLEEQKKCICNNGSRNSSKESGAELAGLLLKIVELEKLIMMYEAKLVDRDSVEVSLKKQVKDLLEQIKCSNISSK